MFCSVKDKTTGTFFKIFDHEQIEEIFHLGLSADEDNEEKEFKENLKKIVEEANRVNEQND